jgi:plastocyanin
MKQSSHVLAAAATGLAIVAATVWLHAAESVVSQKNLTFTPGAVTVKVGDSLQFKNDDDVTHNAFSTSKGNEFNSKAQQPGQTASVTFKVAGQVDVRCAFHPKMTMTVTVK